MKGCLQAKVAFGDHIANTVLYIVKSGSAVLGRDLFYLLQMQVTDGQVTSVSSNQFNPFVANVAVKNWDVQRHLFTELRYVQRLSQCNRNCVGYLSR